MFWMPAISNRTYVRPKFTNCHTAIIVITGRACCIKKTKYTHIKVKYKNIVVIGLPCTFLQHLTF